MSMYNPFEISEVGRQASPLIEQAKEFKMLPGRILNGSLEKYCHGLHENIDNLNPNTIQNKKDGLQREIDVEKELMEKYPGSKGFEIISEAYLRDSEGNIVKDPEIGNARRVDFVVVKDSKVVDSIEVTSETADKTEQTAKENRIREAGGRFVRTSDGSLAEFPSNLETIIERRK